MKIYQVLNSTNLGGGELVALHIADSLKKLNLDSEVLVPDVGPAYFDSKNKNIVTKITGYDVVNSKNLINSLIRNILFRARYARGMKTIIHFHSPFIYKFFSKSLYFSNVKSVVHVHLESDDIGLQWAFRDPPDVICVCANFLEHIVRKNLHKTNKKNIIIKVLPNAIDLDKFYPGNKSLYRKKLNIKPDVFFVLLVADLSAHKGHETAIRSISKLKSENFNICLWLVGKARDASSDYVAQLKNLICVLNLQDNVFLVGHRADVPDLMRAADCLLLPSTREGLPLSILEAQASGLPVIASPISGIPEAISDGETGFLVQASDWEGYADKLKQLIRSPFLQTSISESAIYNSQRDRRWSSYIDNLLSIYKGLL